MTIFNLLIPILIILLKILVGIFIVVLVLIAMILFIPIKYKIDADYLEKVPRGSLSLSWFFGFLKLDLVYDKEQKPGGRIHLLGIKIYDFFKN